MYDAPDVTDPTVLGTFKLRRWSFDLPIPLWMNWGAESTLWRVDFRVVVAQAVFDEKSDKKSQLTVLQENAPPHATDHVMRERDGITQVGYRFAAQGAQPVVQWYFLHRGYLLDLRMIFQLERDLGVAHAIADSVKPVNSVGENQ